MFASWFRLGSQKKQPVRRRSDVRLHFDRLEDRTTPTFGGVVDTVPRPGLDPAFLGDGTITTSVGLANNEAFAVAVQADGRAVSVGTAWNGSNEDFAVVRYNLNGTLDTSFGFGGKVLTSVGPGIDNANSVAIQPDGKILVAGYAYNAAGDADFAVVRYNTNGTLDLSFNVTGKAVFAFGTSADIGQSLAIQPDGKIVVAGYSQVGSNYQFALARINTNGTLDSSFNTTGKVLTIVGSSSAFAKSVSVQPNGKILVAGSSSSGSTNVFAMARYNPDGSLDGSFGTSGMATTSVGGVSDLAECMTVQPDGKIVVAGSSYDNINTDFAVARFNADGTLDLSFNTTGKVTTAFGDSFDDARSVTVQSDGKIVIAGTSAGMFALARYQSNGTLDVTFDGDGMVTTAIGSTNAGRGVALLPDGKVVGVGSSFTGSQYDFALVRYNADGSLDTRIGGAGFTTTAIGSFDDTGRSTLVLPDGKILVAGSAFITNTYDFALVRYNANGTLDTSFGVGGRVTTPIGAFRDVGTCLALQSDGKILISGSSYNEFDEFSDFSLARYNADGTLDPSFGTSGKVTTSIRTGHDLAYSIAVQSDGKILLAGSSADVNSTDEAFALVRYNENGTLDATFGTSGKVITAFGASNDGGAFSLTVQPNGKILLGGYSRNAGADTDFTLVRYETNGSLDAAFGTSGIVTTRINGSSPDVGYSVMLQPDGKILLAGVLNDSFLDDFAVIRYQEDGTLDASFGTLGKVITPIGYGSDDATGLALQSDGKILGSGYSQNGYNLDFTLVRYNTNGSLDTSFGTTGKVTTPIGTGSDFGNSLTVQPDGKIVVAGTSFTGFKNDFAVARYDAYGDPVGAADAVATNEDTPVVVEVLGNDHKALGNDFGVLSITAYPAQHGTVTLVGNQLRYTPNPNFNGTDTFSYLLSQQYGGSVFVPVTVTVLSVNDPPIANNDSATVAEDGILSIDVLGNDNPGPDVGESLSIQSFGQCSHGTVAQVGGAWTYLPAANFNGVDSFTYTISDGHGGTATAIVHVTVTPGNDNPTAGNDFFSTNEDTPITFNPMSNDSSAPDTGETLTVQSVTQGSLGSVTIVGGQLKYTPNANVSGTDSFTYTITDGNGGTATATVNVVIHPVNDTPTATTDIATVTEDGNVSINVLANDSFAPDVGETLSIQSFGQGLHGSVTLVSGQLRYTPIANFNGTDSFTYTISDSHGTTATAIVNVTVNNVNDSPIAVADILSLNEDKPTTFNPLLNDSSAPDSGEALAVQSVTQGSRGKVTIVNGQIKYTPTLNANGTDSFTYTLSDGHGGTATASVQVNILPVNDPPVNTVPKAQSVAGNRLLPLYGVFKVASVDGVLRITRLSVDRGTLQVLGSTNGIVIGNTTATVAIVGTVAQINTALARVEYLPLPRQTLAATLTMITNDQGGTDSDSVKITITRPAARALKPALSNKATVRIHPVLTYSTHLNQPLTVPVSTGVAKAYSNVSASPLRFELVNLPKARAVQLSSDGSFTFKPANNRRGTFSFQVRPIGTIGIELVATVRVTVE